VACSGAAGCAGPAYGGSTRVYGGSARVQGRSWPFRGACGCQTGTFRIAAGKCCLLRRMIGRRTPARRPGLGAQPLSRSPEFPFLQVRCPYPPGARGAAPLFPGRKYRPGRLVSCYLGLVIDHHFGDVPPEYGFKSPSDTLNPHERPVTGMLDRHPRPASGRGGWFCDRLVPGRPSFLLLVAVTAGAYWSPAPWVVLLSLVTGICQRSLPVATAGAL
jgi:hypothetical protein